MTIKEIKEEILSVRMEIDKVFNECYDKKLKRWRKNFSADEWKYYIEYCGNAYFHNNDVYLAQAYFGFLYRKLRNLQLKLNREFWKKFRKTP